MLHLRGQDNALLALVATNLLDTLPHLQTTLLNQLASIMAGEIYPVDSSKPGFSYLAWHCSYYNRYAENVSTNFNLPQVLSDNSAGPRRT